MANINIKFKKNTLELESARSAWDCGGYGKSFEESITGHHVKSAGKVDYNAKFGKCECKTGAGELANVYKSSCKYVVYEPVAQGEPFYQGFFVVEREAFLEALEAVGAVRAKVKTDGTNTVSIQTFYNRAAHQPHGKLLWKIVEALDEVAEAHFM